MASKSPTKKTTSPTKTADKTRRTVKKSPDFKSYIRKLQKNVNGESGVNASALMALNALTEAVGWKISDHASMNAKASNKSTISVGDVIAAVRQVVPGKLGNDLAAAGTTASEKFTSANVAKNGKGAKNSSASKAGLIFSPALAKKLLNKKGTSRLRVAASSASALAGALQAMVRQLLTAADASRAESKKKTLSPRYLALAIANHSDFSQLTDEMGAFILGGGVKVEMNEKLAPTQDTLRKRTNLRNKLHNRAVKNQLKEKERVRGKASSYVTATRKIKREQKASAGLVLPRASFRRCIASYVAGLKDDVRFGSKSSLYLQQYVEAKATDMFKDIVSLSVHAGRYTLGTADVELAMRMSKLRESPVSFFTADKNKKGLPNSRINRICRRAGALRVSKDAYDALRKVMEAIASSVVLPATVLLSSKRTKTINPLTLKAGALSNDIVLLVDNTTKTQKKAVSAKSPKKSPTGTSPKKAIKKTKKSPAKKAAKKSPSKKAAKKSPSKKAAKKTKKQ